MKNLNKTEQIFVVDADFRIWSGQRKLDTADIRIGHGGELPPEKVANLGNKKIVDPKGLNGFYRLKVETRRFLESYGMPFLGGYACPIDKLGAVEAKLQQIGQEFEDIKQQFLVDYDEHVNAWVDENPEFADEIRRGVLHRDDVEKRISFDFEVFQLQAAGQSEEAAKKLERKVSKLGDDLISEVAQAAKKFSEGMFGKDRISSTTSITLKGIRDKVDGLVFLNGNLKPLSDLITDTLQGYQLHREGRYIEKPFLYQVMAVGLILSDEDKIQDWADGKILLSEFTDNIRSNSHLPLGELSTLIPYDAEEDEDLEHPDDVETEVPAQAQAEVVEPAPASKQIADELFGDLDDIEVASEPVQAAVSQPKPIATIDKLGESAEPSVLQDAQTPAVPAEDDAEPSADNWAW